ncbi:MAG TPA: acetylglutamate kinase [Saprospiraceae bacterium]|nr:acetylglutamate kinase [Saprospiraceae bacterium]MCB9269521.1 acetylglutamate kinase [Lewinellaceae bacterium]HPG06165.1 acetylglutamate kinase [Saprospiraceae bacterium]HPQ98022.1 acetylglutamate kinase [Saprospiraceae bacterium]HRV86214.1 acetylglutamate kinase [Saprospiraceae bacterium]
MKDNPALHVVKIGGALIDDQEKLEQLLTGFSSLPGNKILIHGGGKQASELSQKLGIEPQMIEGRRVTDEATLDIAVMVYAGLLNKRISAWLNGHKIRSLGLSGADLNLIVSKKRAPQPIDFGFVGDIDQIQTDRVIQIIQLGWVPVFCAITYDGKDQLLNTNADSIATQLGLALLNDYSIHLQYISDTPGVLKNIDDPSSTLPFLEHASYLKYKKEGTIKGGMIPKLDNAFLAIEKGIRSIWISNSIRTPDQQAKGTLIR